MLAIFFVNVIFIMFKRFLLAKRIFVSYEKIIYLWHGLKNAILAIFQHCKKRKKQNYVEVRKGPAVMEQDTIENVS